mgnify:CR=1 FL=1
MHTGVATIDLSSDDSQEGSELSGTPTEKTREMDDHQEEVKCLRYIDYICGHVNMKPVIEEVEKILGIPIELIPAPGDTSGPRYCLSLLEHHIVHVVKNKIAM